MGGKHKEKVTTISITHIPLGSAALLMTKLFGGIGGKIHKCKSVS